MPSPYATLVAPASPVTVTHGLLLVLVAPLVGALVNGLFGAPLQRRFGERVVHVIAVAAMLVAAIGAVVQTAKLFALPADARTLIDHGWTLLALADLRIDFALTLDALSAVLLLVITSIGTLIHVYATAYMHGDPGQWRFFAALNLFVAAMLLLVLGDSLLLAFFGWEGVGLCSYLLIGFWYGDEAKAGAARKAFVTNRVGDLGFVLGMVALFWTFADVAPALRRFSPDGARRVTTSMTDAGGGRREVALGPTLSFRELRDQVGLATADGRRVVTEHLATRTIAGLPAVTVIALLLLLAATGKSAQLPLQVWLPDAMAGPTPVSALIHAATMVTAGVYLVARLSFLFSLSASAGTVITVVGALTALAGALAATVQHDLKRVLAYSTISQLGFMFVAVGTGAYAAGVFHLVTHACFKACLFLAAGSVIHGMHHAVHRTHPPRAGFDPRFGADPGDPQDVRNMGGLARLLPRTHLAYLVGCIAIAGLPVASGFYSKDEILLRALTAEGILVAGPAVFAVVVVTAGLTAYYMARSYYLVFHARKAPAGHVEAVHESPAPMTLVLFALAVLAVVVGPVLGWPEAWGGHPLLARTLEPTLAHARFAHAGVALELALQAAGVLVALGGWGVARALFRDAQASLPLRERLAIRLPRLHALLYGGLGFDAFYGRAVIAPVRDAGRALAGFDRGFIDGIVHATAALARGAVFVGGWLDRRIVDGVVNGVADGALAAGRKLSHLQTGRIGHYVFGLAAGVLALSAVVLAWFFS